MTNPKRLLLERCAYTPHFTLGRLYFNGQMLYTLERPWVLDPLHGSRPFKSCVPEGTYELLEHSSNKYPETWLFHNSALKVYPYPAERPNQVGRYTCLFHAANFADEVQGCIAPGLDVGYLNRVNAQREYAVVRSGDAMRQLTKFLSLQSSLDNLRLVITGYPPIYM